MFVGHQGQALALVGGHITQMFPHQLGAPQAGFFDEPFIRKRAFLRAHQAHGQVFQHRLFFRFRLVKLNFIRWPAWQGKIFWRGGPAQND